MPKTNKREHLVATAQRLFYQEGIKGTGIDRIIEEAAVAKRTLYNHFNSKDELIIAALHRRDAEFMTMLTTLVEKYESKQSGDADSKRYWHSSMPLKSGLSLVISPGACLLMPQRNTHPGMTRFTLFAAATRNW